jgi:phospholipid/cholesterol/gamma-HCH transport system substrate-binding protein
VTPPRRTQRTDERPPAPAPRDGSPGGAGRSRAAARAGLAARAGAAAAIVAAVVVVLVLVLGGGSNYTISADFQNASGLVTGDNVLIGPAAVGTISSIGLTPNGQARVTMKLHGQGTLHQGTVARVYEDSLSGIASRYVELEPGPSSNRPLRSGQTITATHTYSEVNLDEIFDTLNGKTRSGLSKLIRGEATSLKGKGAAANRTLKYLAPGLQSATEVTKELARDQPAFDGLVVKGADAFRQLAARSQQLTQLIRNTSAATGAIARQSSALKTSLSLLPSTLKRSTTTFQGLDRTLDALDPVVAAAKPASRRLPEFASELQRLSTVAIPTVKRLDDLIVNPSGTGDLTSLALASPSLAAAAAKAFPALIRNFSESRDQISYLREYTPDVVAALSNIGQASSYYDANGHYVRTQPDLFAFAINGSNQLVAQDPALRYQGLQHAATRCPGGATQASPDGSSPRTVTGCSSSTVPPGP